MIRFTRPSLALLASVAAGLVAVVVAARWVGQQAQVSTTPVVVTTRDLPAGTRLAPDMLQTVAWPAGSRPEHSSAQPTALAGRVITVAMVRGEPVLGSRLAPQGERGGLSALLPEGRRAMTVKVSEIVGVAGFALPGHYVDVMVNTQDAQSRPTSKIVLERILVLAVAQDAAAPDNKPRVVNAVTLEVTPEQAERIDLARNVGAISLVLRNQADVQPVATPGARRETLLGEAAPAAAPARAAAPQSPVAARPAAARPVAAPARAPSPPPPAENPEAIPSLHRLQVIRGTQSTTLTVPDTHAEPLALTDRTSNERPLKSRTATP